MPTRSSSSTPATSCPPDPWSMHLICCSTARGPARLTVRRQAEMKRILSAVGVAVLFAGTALLAQRGSGFPGGQRGAVPGELQQPSAPTPTFRVQVDAIEIEAFVTDEQGKPVTGLRREDFQIFEDGKRQNIT